MTESISSKAVVTGATGFIGSHLVKGLVAGGWEVYVITRAGSNLHPLRDICHHLKIHSHDGSTEELMNFFRTVQPDMVFHLAAFSSVHYHPKDIVHMLNSNVIFGTQLVEAMTANGVYHLVNTGTFSQHFENKAYSPTCLYAATKQAFEDILTFYCETTPLKVTTLKLYDNFGPGDPRPKIISLLKRAAQENAPLKMSPGEQLLDILYIEDVVDAFIHAADLLINEQKEKLVSYAVSSGKPIRLKDLVAMIERMIGKRLKIEWGGLPYRPREAMSPWISGNPLPKWTPKVSLEEGLRMVINA